MPPPYSSSVVPPNAPCLPLLFPLLLNPDHPNKLFLHINFVPKVYSFHFLLIALRFNPNLDVKLGLFAFLKGYYH